MGGGCVELWRCGSRRGEKSESSTGEFRVAGSVSLAGAIQRIRSKRTISLINTDGGRKRRREM